MKFPTSILSPKLLNWTWFPLVLILVLAPLLSQAGPAHHRSRGNAYGGIHRSHGFGPSFHHRPYTYSYPRYFPGYTHAYPRFQRYGYFQSYGTYGYQRPGYYYYQNFPAREPRIYVVPQRRSSAGTTRSGPRYLIHYTAGDPLQSGQLPEYDGPPVADQEGFIPPPAPPKVDPQKAWDYMDRGLYRQAIGAFGHQSRANPENAQAKLGFGLAAALTEDKISAVYGIRLALETDPDVCQNTSLSQTLRGKINSLTVSLERSLKNDPDNLDLQFLNAAMHHLIGEHQQAMASLKKAQSLGETSLSSVNLKKAVMQQSGP